MNKKVAVQGVPFDEKSSFLRGAAQAPPLIREALFSDAYNSYSEQGVEVLTPELTDFGEAEISSYFQIEPKALKILQEGYQLLTWGGDHSITYPLIRAFHQIYGPLSILQIDAHSDLYHEFEGDPYSHACPFARIMEEGLAQRLVQVGVRAMTPHLREQADRFGVEVIEMKDYSLKKLLPLFFSPGLPSSGGLGGSKGIQGGPPLYLSLDLDGLDPAYAPGVSHQEAGGLSSRQVIDIIHQLPVPLVGADIVEYNPTRDHAGITAALAGKLSREILANMLGK